MNADLEEAIENLEDLVDTLKRTNDMFDDDECESLLDQVEGLKMDVTMTLITLRK
tara:strand:- start:1836 stop:2000 length:165 start_codon:yes stop_codon:yes gene_type:complete